MKFGVVQCFVEVVVEVNLKRVCIDVELTFAHVALVLEVRVINPSAAAVLFNVLALDSENLDAI